MKAPDRRSRIGLAVLSLLVLALAFTVLIPEVGFKVVLGMMLLVWSGALSAEAALGTELRKMEIAEQWGVLIERILERMEAPPTDPVDAAEEDGSEHIVFTAEERRRHE